MMYYLLLTAFTVSIDSFVCGFSLSFTKGKKIYIPLIITITVFIMCVFTNYFVMIFEKYLTEKSALIGAILLILIGLFNLIKKDEEKKQKNGKVIKESFISGIAVGFDGALANLSLSIMKINAFYVPITIAIMHGIMVSLGIVLRNSKLGYFLERYNFIPPLILILLGFTKIATTIFV